MSAKLTHPDDNKKKKSRQVKKAPESTIKRNRALVAQFCGEAAGGHDKVAVIQEAIADIRRRLQAMQGMAKELHLSKESSDSLEDCKAVLAMLSDSDLSIMRQQFWNLKYSVK